MGGEGGREGEREWKENEREREKEQEIGKAYEDNVDNEDERKKYITWTTVNNCTKNNNEKNEGCYGDNNNRSYHDNKITKIIIMKTAVIYVSQVFTFFEIHFNHSRP